jgi:hypothetical protein
MFRALMLIVVVSTVGCRPLLDGGWEGSANCGNDAFPVSAIFNENGEGEVDGVVYIEGIFNAFVIRGDVDDGAFDPQDNEYNMDLQTDSDETADFQIDMAYGNDPDELEGDVDVIDDEGQVVDTCQLDLNRVDVND